MATSRLRKSSDRWLLRHGSLLLSLSLVFAWLALAPAVRAVSPAPDGGYPGNNTAEGTLALFSLTNGIDNTALGSQALYHNTTGSYNTAEGFRALFSNTIGLDNTANGAFALYTNSGGDLNTAIGYQALFYNTTGGDNTANGAFALFSNTTGNVNTAVGYNALFHNTSGTGNVAVGRALQSNTAGNDNTATGTFALFINTTGSSNTATGDSALYANTGNQNTAIGATALGSNHGGSGNTAVGFNALSANTTGSNNIAVGIHAGSSVATANNVICIGENGANVSNTCFIGNIRGVKTQNANAIPVLIDSAGQLGTMSSSARFKEKIKPMEKASEAIRSLKPVTFHYKSDATGTPQFGLIAEEVAEVNPDLVVRDENGQIYTVRYEAVNAMLLNEFLKEHKAVQEQGAMVAELKKQIATLVATVKEQASQIQKVSHQLELSKPAPQVVNNP